jgi:hypothetical protein
MSIPPPGYETPQASPPPPPPHGAPLSHEDAKAQHAGRQADEDVQYEFKSVQALRGRESSAKAKWQDQGWEFVSENRGTLRTELNFRRVKPKRVGAYLLSFVATFRRLQPKTQSVLAASCALILIAGIIGIGIVLGTQGEGDTPNPRAAQTTASTAPPSEPESETSEVDASQSSGPADEQVLTADNSRELAALLALPDYCDQTVARFATEYSGRTVEFDGSIANMASHGDYDTRYDILIAPGTKGPESTVGPAFKFEDVNVFELNLTGAEIPDSVGEGDRFHFVAQIVEYNPDQCLLFLEPVSTGVR